MNKIKADVLYNKLKDDIMCLCWSCHDFDYWLNSTKEGVIVNFLLHKISSLEEEIRNLKEK